jgi:hypothetical protein
VTAPASPYTYEQAVAAAAAIHAAGGAPADPVATLATMSEQVATTGANVSTWAKSAIRRLWASVDPYDVKQVQAFAVQAAGLMQSAQTAAARVASAAQALQLSSVGIVVDAAPSLPIDVRAPGVAIVKGRLVLRQRNVQVDYAGPGANAKVSKADMTTEGVFKRPAAVFRYARSEGANAARATDLAVTRIDDLVDDNVMLAQRLAQQQVLVQAVVDLDDGKTRSGSKVIGYRRVMHPELSRGGTCGMCIAASDRIYHVGQLLPIHKKCHCTICAVTEDYDPADDLNAVDLSQLYRDAGGTSSAHLKRTRYQVDQHGELGPVLVPKAKYKPRTTKSKVRVGGTALQTDQPAQAEVARRQLEVMEDSLAKLQASGESEDSPKIAYHRKLIDKLRKQADEIAAAGGGGGGDDGGEPPRQNGRLNSGDDPIGRLNRLFSKQTSDATPAQRASVVRWQEKDDRFYQQVQNAIEGKAASDDAVRVAHTLDTLATPLAEDVLVWRGIRDVEKAFPGVDADNLDASVGQAFPQNRFTGTSADRRVAEDEFTRPGRNPVLLRVRAKAGPRAVWVPPVGDPSTAYQQELLFTPGIVIRILSIDRTYSVPIVEVEVSDGG